MFARLTFVSFSLFILLLLIGGSYQFWQTQKELKKYPPPGKLVDIGGYKLHLYSSGSKGPAVVIDSGLDGFTFEWQVVQSEIAQFAQVVTYDRAGMGWSEKSPFPRTSEQIVLEMHELLERAGVSKPYILVGHSFGGINVQLYAVTYPDEVSGLVLVDSAHEEQMEKLPPHPQGKEINKIYSIRSLNPFLVSFLSSMGIFRMFSNSDGYKALVPCNDDIAKLRLALSLTKKHICTVSEEVRLLAKSLEQLKKVNKSRLYKIPCYVLRADHAMRLSNLAVSDKEKIAFRKWEDSWKSLQEDIASRYENSHLLFADKSDHLLQWNQPELIVQAVKKLVIEK